jgi:hypothetical protein
MMTTIAERSSLALQIALGLDDVVGTVEQDAVAALAGGWIAYLDGV